MKPITPEQVERAREILEKKKADRKKPTKTEILNKINEMKLVKQLEKDEEFDIY
ncbi:hypothetical protein HJ160_24180 [Vibrio parahaemolyticus]|uniref:hypothetical protein n=1 Tax=Photobacterium sp. GSS17 TaxID=3020715 RepID=UPI001D4D6E00|nr:hypothetical protein [Photobacterium sp. GSS17]MBE3871803.1 hypothetical protein [Vibrio parahaemolyticus]